MEQNNNFANNINKIILETRAGAGGDEASLFAGDLARMYQKYALKKGWQFLILDASESGARGAVIKLLWRKFQEKEFMIL